MSPSATLLGVLTIVAIATQCAFSFPIRSASTTRVANKRHVHPSALYISLYGSSAAHRIPHARLNLAEGDTTEDDGWGDEKVGEKGSEATLDKISKSQELQRLQNDLANKQSNQSSNSVNSGPNNGGDRDLFIPIVALVSVIGFSSLYAYETLRLASRGELYLPWNN